MKRYFAIVMATLIWCMSLIWVVSAEDITPGGDMTLEGNNGTNPWQWGSMPDDVKQQAQQQQQKALTENEKKARQQRYDDCIYANPGDTSYCNCVADGWVKLNTNVPFIGRCINKEDSTGTGSTTSTAFTDLIWGLSKIVVTAILIVSFMFVIIGGVQRASWNPEEWKAKIMKVVIWLAILGASGAILRLINPNFFR